MAPQTPSIGPRPPAAFVGALGIALVVLAAFAISTLGRDLPFGLDQGWHDWLAANRNPVADILALFLNQAGGTLVMTIVTLAVVALLVVLRRRRAALSVALTVLLSSGAGSLIKFATARPRPLDGVVIARSDSFPSGHATTAAAITVALLIAFPRVWSWVLASTWIPLMALSRTYLLVHWLSDVVAGVVLGASVALLVAAIVRRFLKEASPHEGKISGFPQGDPASLAP